MNRLIISLAIEIDNGIRTIIFLNCYGKARFDSPTSLPKSSDIRNDTDICSIDNQAEKCHTFVIFNEVAKTKLLCISNMVVGIMYKINDNVCIGMEKFEGIICTEQDISMIIIKQYCIFGLFLWRLQLNYN